MPGTSSSKRTKVKNVAEPPDSEPYFDLYANKFDFEIARNVLLNFIDEKGLNDQFMAYLDKHFPQDADGYR